MQCAASRIASPRSNALPHARIAAIAAALAVWLGQSAAIAEPPKTWLQSLPESARPKILWSADYESGNLDAWQRPPSKSPGSGIFNTGEGDAIARATKQIAHSGHWSLETTIQNAYRAKNGPRAVRLMAWTDRAWDAGGTHFPHEAYYSTWIYFPHVYDPAKQPPWDPGDGGWWNVMQFKSEDAQGKSQPMWVVDVSQAGANTMAFRLYSPRNQPASLSAHVRHNFPAKEWLHLEAYYKSATGPHGKVVLYQNGEKIIDAASAITSLGGKSGTDTHPVWGIGNYTDHIAGDPAGLGRATVYFDDTAISTASLGQYAKKALESNGKIDGKK